MEPVYSQALIHSRGCSDKPGKNPAVFQQLHLASVDTLCEALYAAHTVSIGKPQFELTDEYLRQVLAASGACSAFEGAMKAPTSTAASGRSAS